MVQADVDRIFYNRRYGADWMLFEARPLQAAFVELPGLPQVRLYRALSEYRDRAREPLEPAGEDQHWTKTTRPDLLFEIFSREKIQFTLVKFADFRRQDLPDRGTGNPSVAGAKKRLKGAAWILGIALFGYWILKDERTRKPDNWVYID